MATKEIYDVKLQVRVENGSSTSGKTAYKNINVTQVKLGATDDELLAAGQAIGNLQANPLSGVRLVNSYDLSGD
mgnify:CR=1 FL=1